MAGVIVDTGLTTFLDQIRTGTLNTAKVRLYKNNRTPTQADTPANYTEADFSGYAAQTPTWVAATITSDIAKITCGTLTFTHSAGATDNSLYGWFLTDSGNTVLYAAQIDPHAPFTMSGNGTTYQLTPSITLKMA